MKFVGLPFLVALSCSGFGQGWNGDVATIPTTASVISFKQGLASLSVQAGSVLGPTPIYLGPCPVAPSIPTLLRNSVFSIGRPMLTLSKPATLTLTYFEDELPNLAGEATLRLYVLKNGKWTLVGGTVSTANNTVTATITRAGTYGLLAATSNTTNANSLFVHAVSGPTLAASTYPLPTNTWFDVDTSGVLFGAGTDAREVGRAVERPSRSFVSPAGNAIFFVKDQLSVNQQEIYVANIDGSHSSRISNLGRQYIGDGAVSGDGRTISFFTFGSGVWSLFKANADGSAMTQLQTNISSPLENGPPVAINPGATQIAFGLSNSVVVYNATTNTLIRQVVIAPTATRVLGLAFNAAGTVLAVTTDTGLYTVGSASGSPITRQAEGGYTGPVCWHPDGTLIAVGFNEGVDILRLSPKTWFDYAMPQIPNMLYKLHWR